MIIGIGTDIVEIKRIEKAFLKKSFSEKYFTKKEIDTFGNNITSIAGNFSVKESVSKCFGTGFRGFEPIEIEVLRDEMGKPFVNLYNQAKKISEELGIKKIHVSITNTKEIAQAFVVCES